MTSVYCCFTLWSGRTSELRNYMLAVGLEIKNKIKNSTICPTGAYSIHPIAMKLSQVVGNMLAVVLEI